MSTEQGPEGYDNAGGDDNVSIGDRPTGERIGSERVDNREFRRSRHRECYCRGRNKNCPKCQGTGQLLPNWRENLQAARQSRPPVSGPAGAGPSQGAAPSSVAPSAGAPAPRAEYRSDAPASRQDSGPRQDSGNTGYSTDRDRDRGGDRGERGDRYERRGDRRDRWQNRNREGGPRTNRQQGTKNQGKVCPMCGEFVPNLRAHVLARHDDPVPD